MMMMVDDDDHYGAGICSVEHVARYALYLVLDLWGLLFFFLASLCVCLLNV